MTNKLLEKMKAAGSIKVTTLSESTLFNTKDTIPTQVPIINVAFSGSLFGGLVSGVTFLAGPSKCYKTLLALLCMKAYLSKYPDSIALLYDSEFGITPEYLADQGIDASRVIHIPLEHIEQLKFDIVKRLESVERGDKVFIMVDSLGALGSKKELDDALEEKSVADMTRAKAIRSVLRIVTPHLTMKDLPCVIINHTYSEMALYPKQIMGGGTATLYSANQVFFISRSQEKEGTEVTGWNFTLNIEKSRFVKEKAKLTFQVMYDGGINKWSGIIDLALESGHMIKTGHRYQFVNQDTGEVDEKKWKESAITDEQYETLLKDEKFSTFVKNKFMLTSRKTYDTVEESVEGDDE